MERSTHQARRDMALGLLFTRAHGLISQEGYTQHDSCTPVENPAHVRLHGPYCLRCALATSAHLTEVEGAASTSHGTSWDVFEDALDLVYEAIRASGTVIAGGDRLLTVTSGPYNERAALAALDYALGSAQ